MLLTTPATLWPLPPSRDTASVLPLGHTGVCSSPWPRSSGAAPPLERPLVDAFLAWSLTSPSQWGGPSSPSEARTHTPPISFPD